MKWGRELVKILNGLFFAYKNPDIPLKTMADQIQTQLCNELNSMPFEPQRLRTTVEEIPIVGDSQGATELVVNVLPDIVDTSLVLGPWFRVKDLSLYAVNPLSTLASGVQVFGVGSNGHKLAAAFESSQFMRVYRVRGMFGQTTTDGTSQSRIQLRSTWAHVSKTRMERLLGALEMEHRKQIFLQAGVRPQSSAAFKAAATGELLRPSPLPSEQEATTAHIGHNPLPTPVIYGVRCVQWEPPFFVLELQMLNEREDFLIALVQDLAVNMKTTAVVTHIRRLRHGLLRAQHALLQQDCTVANVIENIDTVTRLHPETALTPDPLLLR